MTACGSSSGSDNDTDAADFDRDGIADNQDEDDDNDGVLDINDVFPLNPDESLDTDLDGIGNNADTDDDNDGVADSNDVFALNPNESLDTDNDGIGNNADTDDDNDGVLDVNDAFALDPSESLDTDGDGIGNNADMDDDNDGVLDVDDAYALDPAETIDTDLDGIGNNADTDDDNDGVLDVNDAFTLNPSESVDTDGDGIGNNADTDDDNDGVEDALDDAPLDALVFDSTPPTVQNSIPVHSQANILIDSTVVVNFSEPLNIESINSQSVVLTDGLTEVDTNLSLTNDGLSILISPNVSMKKATAYTLTLNNVEDIHGNALSSEVFIRFITEDFQWSEDTIRINTAAESGKMVHLEDGNLISVFNLNSPSNNPGIWVKLYSEKSGWDNKAIRIDSRQSSEFNDLQVAVSEKTNIVVSWVEKDEFGSNNSVWSAYYNRSSDTWKDAELMEFANTTVMYGMNLSTVLYKTGYEFILTWAQRHSVTGRSSLYSRRYLWEEARWEETLFTLTAENKTVISDFSVASDLAGLTHFAWAQHDQTGRRRVAATRSLNHNTVDDLSNENLNTLSEIQIIENAEYDVTHPSLAFNNQNEGVLVWAALQQEGGVYASLYQKESQNWSLPLLISDINRLVRKPLVELDNKGNALVIWQQNSRMGEEDGLSIGAARYENSMWFAPTELDSSNGALNINQNLSMDSAGKAIACWEGQKSGNVDHLMWSRYIPGIGWTEKEVLLENGTQCETVFDAFGRAVMMFEDSGLNVKAFGKELKTGDSTIK